MKRILFTLDEIPTGAERVVQTIARQLDKNLYEACFCTLATGDDFMSFLQEYTPDVVFCSQIHLAKKVADAVCVYGNIELVFRCNYMLQDVSEEIVAQAASAYPKAKMVIAQTTSMRNQLLDSFDLDSEKVIVYHNPVDVEHITALAGNVSPYPEDGCTHFVWVGRFDPIKDLDTLLKAFSIVHQQKSNTSLYLVGDCPNPEAYQQDGVHLVGYQANPYPWMKYADCFVLSSKSEACPNVLLEASALGTKIVTTRCCTEIEDVVKSGLWVNVGDFSSLSETMLGCISLVESFVEGKKNADTCEDGIVVTSGFYAVIDGCTSKASNRLHPYLTNGKFAMRLVSNAIKQMPITVTKDEFLSILTNSINLTYVETGVNIARLEHIPLERLTCTLAVYSSYHKEIWIVGDCQALVDGIHYQKTHPVETDLSNKRALYIKAQLAKGIKPSIFKEPSDPGRLYILEELCKITVDQNKTYSVIDGFPVYKKAVMTINVADAAEIVLSTDGYPKVCQSLQQSESVIKELYDSDPMCINLFKTTKGIYVNNKSYDDRAYLRIKIAK